MDYLKDSLMTTQTALLDTVVRYILRQASESAYALLLCSSAAGMTGRDRSHRAFVGATMVELLHTATLVHDDVVDQCRRATRLCVSINAVWKNKLAVLVGDYLLSKGLVDRREQR